MGTVTELNHPLVQHHLTHLRDSRTSPHIFRAQVRRLAILLAEQVCRDLPLKTKQIETPLEPMDGKVLSSRIGLVPILRAGLGMTDALLDLLPTAEVWHLGFYRDEETLQPVEYYQKFSSSPPDVVFVLDPMLATGGSASESINMIKKWGASDIRMLSIIAAPEGIARVRKKHPDVPIFVCGIDRGLNNAAYILPGLGDAGDRIFNTLS
ncbi:uracil phosphoribosyltransferase [Tichowtungia aerotolerans]|uniref:Uracil phosphoribosyltransferase n=1 Tax=Tichowtungia aerotolerans TaxID=2697043 RepID=A0A6P1MEJ3_9BACT|nr:uracil phosphoribosyltransferase [Tichowtungia aerotolerans]QHI69505.1 uracil phosphoribosyltransferase [Tichowtungia aerotolerans]